MANRLRQLLKADRQGDDLQLKLIDGLPTGVVDETVLFTVDSRTARAIRRNRDLIAIEWMNQLRLAIDAEPLSLADAQIQLYGLSSQPQGELSGLASWYGPYFHGRLTAAGEIFDQNELTAAHPSLPFDTFLRVTNQETGRSVIVRINDRGPYVGTRSLDLSRQAARVLGSEDSGVVNYEAVILKPQPVVAQERPSPDAIALNNTR
ncbi:MAG: septal ring lytic transglycosylase RlpA family protein [Microcoleus sp. SIO2G3]|nr:septal ring lytic transglycosylase RlpA family protein [Microcoleus sp. SIO2G3]